MLIVSVLPEGIGDSIYFAGLFCVALFGSAVVGFSRLCDGFKVPSCL